MSFGFRVEGYDEDVAQRLRPAERVEEARGFRRRVPLHDHQLHWERVFECELACSKKSVSH